MPKPSLKKNKRGTIHKGFYTFRKGISPKMNVIVQLEFELAHFEAAVQHFSHCTTGTSLYI